MEKKGQVPSETHKITTVSDANQTSFRIRKEKPATPKTTQQRVPTVYGMPKALGKALPKVYFNSYLYDYQQIDKPVSLPTEI